jgi:sugar phosphate isomerase/epimerase
MLEPLQHYAHVGLIQFMSYPQTAAGEGAILETLRKIAADGFFDAVEITAIKDPAVRRQAVEIIQAAGMKTAFGAQPQLLSRGLNLNDTREDKRREAVAACEKLIDEAYETSATGFAFLSGRYAETDRENAYQALVLSTRELCRYAGESGDLKIVHEIFDYDVDKKSLVGPASLARRYAEDIRSGYDNFGLMVDLSHLPLIHETAQEAILPIKEYIVHAHVGNCVVKNPAWPGYGDLHPRFGYPGSENGVNEIAGFLKILLETGFLNTAGRPMLSIEVKPYGNDDADLVIAGSKRYLSAAWAKVQPVSAAGRL